MPEILQGATATYVVSNNGIIKIKLDDAGDVLYQWIYGETVEEPIKAELEYARKEDEQGVEVCFYLEGDTGKETPYFLSDFVLDNVSIS